MRAIILAAGLGSRLRGHTQSPKCLLELQGKSLLQHQLDALERLGVDDIHVILGYRNEEVRRALPAHVKCHVYDAYELTNNLWTLGSFSELLSGTCLVFFADVRVSFDALSELVASTSEITLLADGRQCLGGTMRVVAKGEVLVDMGSHIPVEQGDGNFIGVARFGPQAAARLAEKLRQCMSANTRQQDYYTVVIPELARSTSAHVIWMSGKPWVEIDDEQDLNKASDIAFAA